MTNQTRASKIRIQSHRDLIVWQKARKLNAMCYKLAGQLPDFERFEMQSQMRRAGVSVPANIAEGRGSFGKGDFARHLSHSRASLAELECLLELATDVGYLELEDIQPALAIADEVSRMLWTLARNLGSRQILPSSRISA